jgi:branched-chain amino acid transport system permease protein
MELSTILDLLANALVAGIMLGGFYAAVSIGISISFGMLDIANISHPAMIMLGSFMAYLLNSRWGLDPLLIMLLIAPLFGLLGMGIYRVYFQLFESREKDPRRGLAFFFGLLFVTDVALILVFGADLRGVETPYVDTVLNVGVVGIPLRLLIPFFIGLLVASVFDAHIFWFGGCRRLPRAIGFAFDGCGSRSHQANCFWPFGGHGGIGWGRIDHHSTG